ncbi:alpha/beta fold hydrolase [Flagellimonas sp. DF-77]|uniref:alpha/beta hydrolase n=1 Tax=Flagellimonas algarum TaxID=3230298 RepID=UPI00339333E6
MRKFLKVLKWLLVALFTLLVILVLYLRFSRFSDKMIYQTNGSQYAEFSSEWNHEEHYFKRDGEVALHGVLFKPDSIPPIATIFHFSGKGMHLMSAVQTTYRPLLEAGFQVFCYERRDFGQSNGEATNSKTLQSDALAVFDEVVDMKGVADTPIIIWGQSLGGAFATMTAGHRVDRIEGLLLEGTFSSFPDIGKVYANALNLEKVKWAVPLIMNNDFPAMEEIQKVTVPTTIIHSSTDKEVPYALGRKLFEAADPNTTRFWAIEGKHIRGILDHEAPYVAEFMKFLQP